MSDVSVRVRRMNKSCKIVFTRDTGARHTIWIYDKKWNKFSMQRYNERIFHQHKKPYTCNHQHTGMRDNIHADILHV